MSAHNSDLSQATSPEKHRSRMIERLLSDKQLSERYLLEILLYYAIPRKDTRDLSLEMLAMKGNKIRDILGADMETLCSIPGIGDNTAAMLRLMGVALSRLQPPDDE